MIAEMVKYDEKTISGICISLPFYISLESGMKRKEGEGFVQFCGKTPLEIKIGERKKVEKYGKKKQIIRINKKRGWGCF